MFFLESKRTKKRGGCDSPAPPNAVVTLNFTLNTICLEFFKKYFIYANVSNSATYASADLNLKTAKEIDISNLWLKIFFKKFIGLVQLHIKFTLCCFVAKSCGLVSPHI